MGGGAEGDAAGLRAASFCNNENILAGREGMPPARGMSLGWIVPLQPRPHFRGWSANPQDLGV